MEGRSVGEWEKASEYRGIVGPATGLGPPGLWMVMR